MKLALLLGLLMFVAGCGEDRGTPREKSLDAISPGAAVNASSTGEPAVESGDRDEEVASSNETEVSTFGRPPIDPAVVEAVRADPSALEHCYRVFRKDARAALPAEFAQLSDVELCAVFSICMAYSMAPYGNSTSMELDDLLSDAKLDCDNYALLAHHLFLQVYAGNPPEDVSFQLVGWNGGAVGNHAQMFVNTPQRSLLLDPTIGVVALCNFDSIASGQPVDASRILDCSTRPELADFRKKVTGALQHGRYKPSDLMYYFEDFEEYKRLATTSDDWPTPGAVKLRRRQRR